MQPIDDQPPEDQNQEPTNGEPQLSPEERQGDQENLVQDSRSINPVAPGESINPIAPGEQMNTYGGASEQIPFSYSPPTAPQPQGQIAPGQPMYPLPTPSPLNPNWNYPPRPEQYMSSAFGPQGQAGRQPTNEIVPGQFSPPAPDQSGQFSPPMPGQSGIYGSTYEAPPGYGSLYQQRTSPFAQSNSGMGSLNQPGIITPPQVTTSRSGMRTGAIVTLIVLLVIVFGSGIFSGWELAHNSSGLTGTGSTLQPGKASTVVVPPLNGNNEDTVREAVISKVQPGVVEIQVTTPGGSALGSGVIVDGRGYIVTNDHVVADATSVEVTLADGTNLPAQVAGTDVADDLAVVKVTPPSAGLTVVALGDSAKLLVGQAVLAIGSPLGNANTVTSGIVSALNRTVSEGDNQPTLPDAIQTDAPINPGNSGGALVDLQGDLVGIPTLNAIDTEFNTPAEGLGFAIPSNRVTNIVQQIITDGRVLHTGRAILGVEVTDIDQSIASQDGLSVSAGALIVDVTSNSAASSAGLQARDVIVQIGSSTVQSVTDLSTVLLKETPGQTVAVKIVRGTQQMTINVTLGELPAE
jgi:S1-C subfamily serine protease